MAVGCQALRQVISDPGSTSPYVHNNGNTKLNVLVTKQHTDNSGTVDRSRTLSSSDLIIRTSKTGWIP